MVTKCLTSLLQMITTNTKFVNFRQFKQMELLLVYIRVIILDKEKTHGLRFYQQ